MCEVLIFFGRKCKINFCVRLINETPYLNMSLPLLGSIRVLKRRFYFRGVFFSSKPQHEDSIQEYKVVNVAIIGAPNSGKSTLINNIVERKICAASNKVHTTTKLARAICFENDTQIVFLDTPGVVTERERKKYELPESMIKACHKSLNCADVIGVVHDISNKWTKDRLHKDVVLMLNLVEHIPSFLILNKIDQLKSKKQLLAVIRNLTNGMIAGNPMPGVVREKQKTENGYDKFSDVFIVSALNGDGVKEIKEYLGKNAKPANLHYQPEEYSDQSPQTLIIEAVRAKFLDYLSQEIPYTLKTNLEFYEEDEDKVVCHVQVECPSDRLLKLISGAGGGRLQQIKSSLRMDLVEMFKKNVVVNIRLTVKKKGLEGIVV